MSDIVEMTNSAFRQIEQGNEYLKAAVRTHPDANTVEHNVVRIESKIKEIKEEINSIQVMLI